MALPHAAILVTVPTVDVVCIRSTILTWIIYTTVFLQCIYIHRRVYVNKSMNWRHTVLSIY